MPWSVGAGDSNHIPGEPRRWEELDEATRTRLRIEYGRHLDGLPPTCSLEEKNLRFARWLAERGVSYAPGPGSRPA